MDVDLLEAVPSLLGGGSQAHVERLGSLDGHLLAVLGTAHLLPPDVWERVARSEGGAQS